MKRKGGESEGGWRKRPAFARIYSGGLQKRVLQTERTPGEVAVSDRWTERAKYPLSFSPSIQDKLQGVQGDRVPLGAKY
jgi:hypothetical protein